MEEGLCKVGELIGSRYKVERKLGKGTFAEVYLAKDTVLERNVAVKVLNPRAAAASGKVDRETALRDTIMRFYKEAKLVASLRDERTVSIYDFGSMSDGKLYMAQEFIDGQSLKALLERERPLSAGRTAHILAQTLRSLREAHTYGLLHRDIKPENIMVFDYLGERDQVRVVDFGIAKTLGEESSDLTAAGVLVGTPRYVAPERVTQKELVPASDIYSVGVVGYEVVTGQELFAGKGMMDVIRAHMDPEPIRLPPQPPVPAELRRIIEKMLAKNIQERYTAAQPAIEDLDRFLASLTIAQATDMSLEQSLESAKTMRMEAIPSHIPAFVSSAPPSPQRTERPVMHTFPPVQAQPAPSAPPAKDPQEARREQLEKYMIMAAAVVAFGILVAAGIIIASVLTR